MTAKRNALRSRSLGVVGVPIEQIEPELTREIERKRRLIDASRADERQMGGGGQA